MDEDNARKLAELLVRGTAGARRPQAAGGAAGAADGALLGHAPAGAADAAAAAAPGPMGPVHGVMDMHVLERALYVRFACVREGELSWYLETTRCGAPRRTSSPYAPAADV